MSETPSVSSRRMTTAWLWRLAEYEDADLPALFAADARGGFADAVMMYGRHEEFDVGPVPRA